MSDNLLLSVRCAGLSIVNLGTKGSSFFSRVYQVATSSFEKSAADTRWITISQSKPFPLNGRAPDLLYETIYTSETFSDLGPNDGIYPSLLANVKCPAAMNCNIRLNVYVESVNLNSGKALVLCGCTFSRKDLMGFDEMSGATYSQDMVSEFCVGSKAFVDIITPMHTPALTNSIGPFAKLRVNALQGKESSLAFLANEDSVNQTNELNESTNTSDMGSSSLIGKKDLTNDVSKLTTTVLPNPLATQYVFFGSGEVVVEGKPHMPVVQIDEMIFEPKRVTQIPVLFFENFAESLKHSLEAWRTRRELEMKRQGFFTNSAEAHSNGWHEISVSVIEARLDCLPNTQRAAQISRPFSMFEPVREDQGLPAIQGKVRRHVPNARRSISSLGLSTAIDHSEVINTRERKKSSILSWGGVKERGDVTRPSTYVSISVHDESQLYEFDLGRTNTEYYQFNPVFGSNAQAHCVKSPNQDAFAANDGATAIEKVDAIYEFRKYEVKDNGTGETMEVSEERTLRHPEIKLINGHDVLFKRFVPSCDNSYLMLDLCIESVKGSSTSTDYRAASPVVGTARIPLTAGMQQDMWVPVKIHAADAQTGYPFLSDAWIHVEVSVKSPAHVAVGNGNSNGNSISADADQRVKHDLQASENAPASMPSTYVYSRSFDSTIQPCKHEDSDIKSKRCADSSSITHCEKLESVLANSYEWLWFCGYSGNDPLAILNDESQEKEGLTLICPRIDVLYPVKWIDEHIEALEDFMMEVLEVLQNLREMHNNARENCFRASVLKKDWQVQTLPINLHIQMVSLRRLKQKELSNKSTGLITGVNPLATALSNGGNDANQLSNIRPDRLIDSLTCGCFTAHAMGHKQGGLETHQRNMLAMRKRLDRLMIEYIDAIQKHKLSAKKQQNTDQLSPHARGLSTVGKEAGMLSALRNEVLVYESSMCSIAKRRLIVMSQVLTVGMNALLLKLALLEEGYVNADVAEQWWRHGFLIVFESLLSVSGNERSMLEDTMVAVETLARYRFRIRKASAECAIADQNVKPHLRIRSVDPSTASVDLRGRELVLTLPSAAIEAMPESMRAALEVDNLIITPIPVLFTQGLDIQQTYENVMGSSSRTESSAGAELLASLELEHYVNAKALETLNTYCNTVKPHSDLDEGAHHKEKAGKRTQKNIHPWLSRLAEHVKFTGKAEKDVVMLMEVQRACHAMCGCKVTFCKSGKDRTGMVITLEQSRILGERYGCGNFAERIIKDSDLMRTYGPRLQICLKNIGKPVYSINKLQAPFLPILLRPPRSTQENVNLFKKDNS